MGLTEVCRLFLIAGISEDMFSNVLCLKVIFISIDMNKTFAGHWWLTPVILATEQRAIRRIAVGSQPGQIVCEILS
jgi:hypothetical protein